MRSLGPRMIVHLSERETLVVSKVAVKPFSKSFPMEMRYFLARAGKICDWRDVRGICIKFRRAV